MRQQAILFIAANPREARIINLPSKWQEENFDRLGFFRKVLKCNWIDMTVLINKDGQVINGVDIVCDDEGLLDSSKKDSGLRVNGQGIMGNAIVMGSDAEGNSIGIGPSKILEVVKTVNDSWKSPDWRKHMDINLIKINEDIKNKTAYDPETGDTIPQSNSLPLVDQILEEATR